MKLHRLRIILLFLGAVSMTLFVGCGKEDDAAGNTTPIITALSGTWNATMDASLPVGGQSVTLHLSSALCFKGSDSASFGVSVQGFPQLDLQRTVAYSWDGNSQGSLHFVGQQRSGDVLMVATDDSHLTLNLTAVIVDDSTSLIDDLFGLYGGTIPLQYTRAAQ